jgi:hypothetical protein
MENIRKFVAFSGQRLVGEGPIKATLTSAKRWMDDGDAETVLVFDDETGAQLDFDWRGTEIEVIERLKEHPAFTVSEVGDTLERPGPGRPKLGVVSREVTLLPRHWQWLEAQSGGISATLRRLVDDARKATKDTDRVRQCRDALSRFLWAMAGNLPNFEEATRALFANERSRFEALTEKWPVDIRNHVRKLSVNAFV